MRKAINNLWAFGLIALTTLITISCGDDEDPFIDPTVAFTTSIADLTVTFTNNTLEAATADYSWDFGDGTGTSTEISPVYTYADYGEYTVTLTVNKEGQTFQESETIQVLDVCDLRTPDSENLIVGGQFEGCDAESWMAIVSNAGGAEGTHGPAKWEFGYTDYAPADGDGGALYIYPDNDESDVDEATMLYQRIEVVEEGQYQISGLMKASGSQNMNGYFFQIYVGQTEPVNNMDYDDNYVSGIVDFTDFAFGEDLPPTDGPMVHTYSPPATNSDSLGKFNMDVGTYYVGIKFGKGTNPAFDLGIA
ncbi:MAG: PKD domain-containing protein, partial [Cyclobacteriaceae bacterium]|nr:PKD domain-containing protein [Cyclobacteriaceae bacterium HetDA_MAG_MS6]